MSRSACCFAVSLFLAAATSAGEEPSGIQPATVAGGAYDAASEAPLAKVRVTLYQTGRGGQQRYSSVTDTGGTFRFDQVAPGAYRLSAEKNRYARAAYGEKRPGSGGAEIVVTAGQRLEGLTVKLTPAAVILGRVLDEDGEPIPHAQATAMRYQYTGGEKRLTPVSGGVTTNDLGDYRMFGLAPGRYYLAVSYRGRGGRFLPLRGPSAVSPDISYPTVFYPGVYEADQAQPLRLAAGEERTGVDFQLAPMRGVRVRGRVVPSGERLAVSLLPRRGAMVFGSVRSEPADPKTGEFEIAGALPGSYTLFAVTRGRDQRLFGRLPVEVGGDTVDGLTLSLTPGVSVSGQLRIEDKPAGTRLDALRVELSPRGSWFGGGAGSVDAEGAFTLDGMAPGTYSIGVNGLPEGAFLKSARFGRLDLIGGGLEVSEGGLSDLAVTVSLKGALLTGVVFDEDKQPAPGALVTLVPDAARRTRPELFLTATTDQYGRFTISGISPGEYRALAFDHVERGAYRDPDFLEPFEGDGEKVKLEEGGQRVVELRLLLAGEDGT